MTTRAPFCYLGSKSALDLGTFGRSNTCDWFNSTATRGNQSVMSSKRHSPTSTGSCVMRSLQITSQAKLVVMTDRLAANQEQGDGCASSGSPPQHAASADHPRAAFQAPSRPRVY